MTVAPHPRTPVASSKSPPQALEELYDRPAEVYSAESGSTQPLNIMRAGSAMLSDLQPIRLSYHGRSHYNSLVDPTAPPVHPPTARPTGDTIRRARVAAAAAPGGGPARASLTRMQSAIAVLSAASADGGGESKE